GGFLAQPPVTVARCSACRRLGWVRALACICCCPESVPRQGAFKPSYLVSASDIREYNRCCLYLLRCRLVRLVVSHWFCSFRYGLSGICTVPCSATSPIALSHAFSAICLACSRLSGRFVRRA